MAMRKVLLVTLLAALLTTLIAFSAQAEVTLKEYHARHLEDMTYQFSEYTWSIYKSGFRQYSQPVSSNGFLGSYQIARGEAGHVPATGDVLLVFIKNPIYLKTGEAGFTYAYNSNSSSRTNIPLSNLKNALSAFPGKVALIVYSNASPTDGVAFNQALSNTFSESKYSIVSFLVSKKTGGANVENVCRALGYTNNGLKALNRIYADANKDRIVTCGELYNNLASLYGNNATSLLTGEANLPIYFSTKRLKVELPEKAHALMGRSSFTIVPIVEPAGATRSMTWSSSNKKVATVKDGVVTGVNPGKATIYLKADGKTLKMKVTVNKVSTTKVSITPWPTDVYVGWRIKMSATIEPATATDDVVSWTSSNKKVATVDNKGTLRTLKDGTTTLTVKTRQGKKGQYLLTVKKKPVDHLEIDDLPPEGPPYETYGTAGFTRRYRPIVWPQDASFKGLRWTSSKPSVASVSSNGTITYKKPGYTIIRVTSTDNPSAYVEFGVTVRANQLSWPAPTPADFVGMEAGLYVLPKRLYYSGSTLMAEVYLYNHTNARIKSLAWFYAAVFNLSNETVVSIKKVNGYAFRSPLAPGKAGVYKFSSVKRKIDLNRHEYVPFIGR